MNEFLRRLRYYVRRRQFDAELEEEMAFHRAQSGERRFGNATRLQEESREAWRWTALDDVARDVRVGVRQMRRSPGFAAVAILSLALGIGANTAVFELLNAVRLRALPVEAPESLVAIEIDGGHGGFGINGGWNVLTYPLFEQIRNHQDVFSSVSAWAPRFEMEVGEGEARHTVRGTWVSGDAFRALGVVAARGRLLEASDDRPGCAATAVVGHGFWQRELGGRDAAIGSALVVGGRPVTIIGVTPPSFFGIEVGRSFDVAMPFCAAPVQVLQRRDQFWLGAVARLRPGWSVERAADYLQTVSAGWFAAVRPAGYDAASLDTWDIFRLTATPFAQGLSTLRADYETSLWLLLGITGLVLLVACANLANLSLARLAIRRREFVVRTAVGATRVRIVQQLFWESLVIAAVGTAVGLLLASVFSSALVQFLSSRQDVIDLDLRLDWRVLAFSSVVGFAACFCFGLSTALHSTRGRPSSASAAAGRGVTADRRAFSFHRSLIVVQVALSLVLVVSSLLFVRSFRNLLTFDPGFQQEGVVFHYLDLGDRNQAEAESLQRQVLERLRAEPDISAALTTHRPLSGQGWGLTVAIPGVERQEFARFTWISPRYFETMEVPIVSGRDVTDFDGAASPRVLLVNEAFVRRFLPGRDPLGSVVRSLAEPGYPETSYEIIGVVGDTKYLTLREESTPIAYAPVSQMPAGRRTAIVTRAARPLSSVRQAVRLAVAGVDSTARLDDSIDLRAQAVDRLTRERMLAWLAGFFGIVGITVAAIGLYGIVSYIVTGRRHEIGIRLALGAGRARIVRMVVWQHAAPVALGLALGTAAALALSASARRLLFGLEPHDPAGFVVATALLAAVAACACLVPARRAAGIEPMVGLRQD